MSKAISAANVNIAAFVLKKLPAGHGLAKVNSNSQTSAPKPLYTVNLKVN